jgi:hypothetical protein
MVQFYRHFPITGPLSSADMADGCLISLKWCIYECTVHGYLNNNKNKAETKPGRAGKKKERGHSSALKLFPILRLFDYVICILFVISV